jgi:hypothetical protein
MKMVSERADLADATSLRRDIPILTPTTVAKKKTAIDMLATIEKKFKLFREKCVHHPPCRSESHQLT